MKRVLLYISLILLAVVLSFCTFKFFISPDNSKNISLKTIETKKAPVKLIQRKPTPEFTQGLYITAYTASLKRFDTLLQKAKDSGINTIIFDVKEMQGYVYYPIEQDSVIKYLESEKLWEINQIVDKIHAYDLVAVARVVQFFNINTARKYPNLQVRNKEGGFWQERPGKPTWLDPSLPEVQNDLKALINNLGKSRADEIQLDYVRFPTEGNLSRASFYFQREDNQEAQADTSYTKREKRQIIAQYVASLKQICKKNNIRLGADVFAIIAWQRAIDIKNTGQDISMMTANLDNLHPMIYSSHFARNFNYRQEDFYNNPYLIVKEGLTLTKSFMNPGCKLIPYLQAFDWKVNYTKKYVFDQIKAVTNTQCHGYILWNAGNNYDRTLNWIKEWNMMNLNKNDSLNTKP